MDRDEVQSIEQIFAKLAASDQLVQRAIGRGNHANIDRARTARSEDFVCSILQHAQQFHLRRLIDFADFIEKNRSAVGDFEAAFAILSCIRECAANVAEHLAFEQRRRNPAEVHFDEGARAAAAVGVNRFRDQLLARAAFAHDQNRGLGGRDAADQFEHAQHFRIAADDLAEVEFRVELRTARRLGRNIARLCEFQRRDDEDGEVFVDPLQLVERLDAVQAGHHDVDDRGVERRRSRERQSLLTRRAAREIHVLNDERWALGADRSERLVYRMRGRPSMTVLLQQERQRSSDRRVVVDDEDHVWGVGSGELGVGESAARLPPLLPRPHTPHPVPTIHNAAPGQVGRVRRASSGIGRTVA